MFDKLLEKVGRKYDDLTPDEKVTLSSWVEAINKGKVTPVKVREHISTMKSAVEEELAKPNNNSKKDIFLKARLKNYLLLEAFISSPEKAQNRLDEMIAGLAPART